MSPEFEITAQCMDACETEEELMKVAGHLRADNFLSEEDKAALRPVFKECLQAIRLSKNDLVHASK